MVSLIPSDALAGATAMITCLVTILATLVGWVMAARH
jgi:hypothetical protein